MNKGRSTVPEALRWGVAAGTASALLPGMNYATLAETENMYATHRGPARGVTHATLQAGMFQDLKLAVRLQEIDNRLADLTREIATLPKHIAEIEKKLGIAPAQA